MVNNNMSISVVTPIIGSATIRPLSNLLKICRHFSEDIGIILACEETEREKFDLSNFISGESGLSHKHLINHNKSKNNYKQVYFYILTQIRLMKYLISSSRRGSVCIFFLGDTLIMQLLIARILGRKTILVIGADHSYILGLQDNIYRNIVSRFIAFSHKLADFIIIYSPLMLDSYGIRCNRNKIYIASEHIVNTLKFKPIDLLDKRNYIIGYIGRFSEEKGILNFVEAIPGILSINPEIRILIGGDGPLRSKLEKKIHEFGIDDRVDFTGWIEPIKLPNYLNRLKLLVLPSFTEGLPNIILEAMACGTPVLVTPVGAIPDIVKDEETGFIMEDNSSKCIQDTVKRSLNYPHLFEVANSARKLVDKEFTYKATISRWEEVFNEIRK